MGFSLAGDNFQTISTPSSYLTYPGLSIKQTGRRLVTDNGTKCAWVIHESTAVQIHVHKNCRCLYVPRVPCSVKNPHNNKIMLLVSNSHVDNSNITTFFSNLGASSAW